MSRSPCTVLILDDDPSHLKIYGWIAQQAGCRPLPVQVQSNSLSLPKHEPVRLVLMDYRYSSSLTAVDVIDQVESTYPGVPIVVFSELYGMPSDMKGRAKAFIRKGEPQELVNRLRTFQETGQLTDQPAA